MTKCKRNAVLGLLGGAALMLSAGHALAQADPDAAKCSSAKQKAIGKDGDAKLQCYSKAATKGIPVDVECLDKAAGKTIAACDKADLKGGCATEALPPTEVLGFSGDTAGLLGLTDEMVANIVDLLNGDPDDDTASKCHASKLKAAGKYVSGLLKCQSKADKKITSVDPKCSDKNAAKLQKAFDKADAKPPCKTTGDASTVKLVIDNSGETAVTLLPRNDGCGSGFTNPPETCDDRNLDTFDSCPEDCVVEFCTPDVLSSRLAQISFASDKPVAGITIALDYPEGKVSILGSGGAAENWSNLQGSAASVNDFDHAVRFLVADAAPLVAGPLVEIDFHDCMGAAAPIDAEFPCTVVSAADAAGKAVTKGVTCTFSLL